MKKILISALLFSSSLVADGSFIDDTFQLKSFIYEMRSVSEESIPLIQTKHDQVYNSTPLYWYHTGKMQAYDDILMWLEYKGGPWTSD